MFRRGFAINVIDFHVVFLFTFYSKNIPSSTEQYLPKIVKENSVKLAQLYHAHLFGLSVVSPTAE